MPLTPDRVELTERMFDRSALSPEPPHVTDTTPPLTFQAAWVIDTRAGTQAMRRAREQGVDLAGSVASPTLQDRRTVFQDMRQQGSLTAKNGVIDFAPQVGHKPTL
ncbi:MAG: hypothetical protein HYV40_04690 [Candidatus Levybacteria bacterium]|nr:hypothetical protein [Candidatus Levybacteria bacterium]